MVEFSNASTDPKAVVIEFGYAPVAVFAVLCSVRESLNTTNVTASIWRNFNLCCISE